MKQTIEVFCAKGLRIRRGRSRSDQHALSWSILRQFENVEASITKKKYRNKDHLNSGKNKEVNVICAVVSVVVDALRVIRFILEIQKMNTNADERGKPLSSVFRSIVCGFCFTSIWKLLGDHSPLYWRARSWQNQRKMIGQRNRIVDSWSTIEPIVGQPGRRIPDSPRRWILPRDRYQCIVEIDRRYSNQPQSSLRFLRRQIEQGFQWQASVDTYRSIAWNYDERTPLVEWLRRCPRAPSPRLLRSNQWRYGFLSKMYDRGLEDAYRRTYWERKSSLDSTGFQWNHRVE